MDKLKDQFRKGTFSFWPGQTWSPSVNLYETDHAYLVCVDLAGVDKDKIDVVVENQQLMLKGTRAVPVYPTDDNAAKAPPSPASDGSDAQTQQRIRVHLMEIDHGAFARVVELPRDVKQDQIRATHRNGMLWVELPKKQ
jgi:HSP20 family protein